MHARWKSTTPSTTRLFCAAEQGGWKAGKICRMSLVGNPIRHSRRRPRKSARRCGNQGGGHLNHSLFWHVMGAEQGGEPVGPLASAIRSTFGDYLKFQEQMTTAAAARFGSGWVWLCVDSGGKLEILSTPNQDSPIMLGYRPVFGIDLWEHAYYLKYQNRKLDYINQWWHVVHWRNVAELYQHCLEMVGRTGYGGAVRPELV